MSFSRVPSCQIIALTPVHNGCLASPLYSRGVGIGAASSQTIAGSAEGALGHLQDQFLFEAVLGEAPSVAEPKSTLREDSPNKATISDKRSGIKQQTAYLALPVYEQVRRLAFEGNTKMHTLLMGGLDRVFKDRGLPSIAELTDKKH